ncbi:uncharacterized protein LOC113468353 [Diaphorina citri]|uniref:Uncharacterized protein LOC113468353 n=1 Tax=Diaphorina citri TaxID=121845 RepID=A0A3Q0IXL1_DIACI|nr:uncharacterized protein LOC113468353 [Diaphorina citri]
MMISSVACVRRTTQNDEALFVIFSTLISATSLTGVINAPSPSPVKTTWRDTSDLICRPYSSANSAMKTLPSRNVWINTCTKFTAIYSKVSLFLYLLNSLVVSFLVGGSAYSQVQV